MYWIRQLITFLYFTIDIHVNFNSA